MFELMNMARIETGLQALAQSSAAYMHAVTYARNRKQGVHFTKMMSPEDSPMVSIIEHPDVQRMLLWMKSNIEGMRMLAYYVSKCVDISSVEKDEEAKKLKWTSLDFCQCSICPLRVQSVLTALWHWQH